MVEQWNSVVEQCGMVWYNSVERYGGTGWWNSVEQWNSMAEQCGTAWWNSVAQCGTVWWNSGTVWRSVVEESNSGTVWWNSVSSVGQCGGTLEQCW